MSVLNLSITTGRPDAELISRYESGDGPKSIANSLSTFLVGVSSGTELAAAAGSPPSIAISVQGSAVQASGTFTLTTVIATDAVKVNGVTFTAVASGATGNQFNIGASDTLTAVNLAAAINGSATALVAGYVTATSALTVVTVKSAFYGIAGNQTLIESLDGTIVASGVALTGGAPDAAAVTLSF